MTRELKPDVLTPRQQRWLDRYRASCPTRRRNFFYQGRLMTRLGHGKRPRYGSIMLMSGKAAWDWIKKDTQRIERLDKARERRETQRNLGAHI